MQNRMIALALLLGAEAMLASLLFDGAQLRQTSGLLGILRDWGAWGLKWAVGASIIFASFAFLKKRSIPESMLGAFVRSEWLAAHAVAVLLFGYITTAIYYREADVAWLVFAWAMSGACLLASAVLSVLPLPAWKELLRQTGSLWILASVASGLACWLGSMARLLWAPVTAATFAIVKGVLGLLVKDVIAQPEQLRLATPRFGVIISPECSGLEGLGLFLIFGLLWLVLFREELRFPQALIVLPVGMMTLYALNALRIAALLLIGDAGWKEIAVRGFHSQAGWIAFNLVAFGLLLGARKIAWIRNAQAEAMEAGREYPAAPYLVPFLAILAAGIVAGAMTAQFEWLYPLRLLAAVGAFWIFRKHYTSIDWRFGWRGVLAGLAVFLLWIAVDWTLGGGAGAKGMPVELANAPLALRVSWLLARIAGAVLAVPVAEELAFRGFGLRRLVEEHFESVPWGKVTGISLGVSSLLFGVLHGGLWFAGIAAGLIYGLVMVWRGRLGESIGAHATTNALLAIYVLVSGRWDLW